MQPLARRILYSSPTTKTNLVPAKTLNRAEKFCESLWKVTISAAKSHSQNIYGFDARALLNCHKLAAERLRRRVGATFGSVWSCMQQCCALSLMHGVNA